MNLASGSWTPALKKRTGAPSGACPDFVRRHQAEQVQILAPPELHLVTGWRTGAERYREPRQAVTFHRWVRPDGQRQQTWLS